MTSSSSYTLTEEQVRKAANPPADLDESIERTFGLYREFSLKKEGAESVPRNIGHLLIALATFGAYRGLTHSGTKTIAGTAALGAGVYAAGTAVDWNGVAAAYDRAGTGLACLITEARSYRILPSQSGRQQLMAAAQAVNEQLAGLDDLVAENAALNQVYLASRASVTKGSCTDPGWSAELCRPPAGTEDAAFERTCHKLQARRSTMCAARTHPAAYSVPSPDVAAVFAAAAAARAAAEAKLIARANIVSASDNAGYKLWSATFSVLEKASEELRRSGIDLAKLMTQLKAARQPSAAPLPTATPQSGEDTGPPPGAKTIPRALDESHVRELAKLEAKARQLRGATRRLDDPVKLNAHIPDRLDEARFDACISAEAAVAQAAVATAAPPPDRAPENAMGEISDAELAGLDLKRGQPQAEVERRLRTCQKRLGIVVDGQLSAAMRKHLREGACKGTPWE